jgi:ubiquitin carboxyl-terminal hydrolase 9/24
VALETLVLDDDSNGADSDDLTDWSETDDYRITDPSHVTVSGAGNPAVNGEYSFDGYVATPTTRHFARSMRFGKEGFWNNQRCKFSIFWCIVSNRTKHWYISIVPYGRRPGTTADIDFYTAPVTEFSTRLPPRTCWIKTCEGMDPPPTLEFQSVTSLRASVDSSIVGIH